MSSPTDWPDLIRFIFEALQLPFTIETRNLVTCRKCAALDILTELLEVFGDALPKYSGTVKELVGSVLTMTIGVNDHGVAEDVLAMRLAALNCLRAYLVRVRPVERGQFVDFIPAIWDTVMLALKLEDEESCSQILDRLIMLAEDTPTFFRNHLNLFVSGLISHIISRRELDDTTLRQSALEFLTILAEKAPAMIRRHCKETSMPGGSFVDQIIPAMLSLMTEIDEDELDDHQKGHQKKVDDGNNDSTYRKSSWSMAEILDDDETSQSVAVVAEIALDRLACALGGKLILPVIFHWLPDMLQSPQWQKRSAAWLALSVIAEGCRKPLEKELTRLVDMIVMRGLRDPHPRVRYACINSIGQMCTDLAPKLQVVYHDKILPGLILTMEDPHPRVQSHAASALVNFCESLNEKNLERSRLSLYLDAILERLFRLLQSKRRYVQEQALQSIASIADAAKSHFERFYDTFMPVLKAILQQVAFPQWEEFQARALECATLIGIAVGKSRFLRDAHDLMGFMYRHSSSSTTTTSSTSLLFTEGPLQSYFLDSITRLSHVLQQDFAPYLPWLMTSLMEKIQLKPEITLVHRNTTTHPDGQEGTDENGTLITGYNDDNDDKVEEEDSGWEYIRINDTQKIGIRTSAIEEKRYALDMVVAFARDLLEAFVDYAEPVLGICLPLFHFYLDEDIRVTAVNACAPLLRCLQSASRFDRCAAAATVVFNQLVLSLQKESEPIMASIYIEAWRTCCAEVLATEPTLLSTVLTEEASHAITSCLSLHLRQFQRRSLEREQIRSDHEEAIDDSLLEEEENDDALLHSMADLIRALLKLVSSLYVPIFETTLLPIYASMLLPIDPSSFATDKTLPITIHASNVPTSWRQWAFCVFDDLIEQLGMAAFKYQNHFISPMLQALNDPHAGTRQAAAYGVGMCAARGGDMFMSVCIEAIPHLVRAIQEPQARNETYGTATENCISALGKIYRYGREHLGDQQDALLDFWLNQLPIVEDVEEAEATYPFLCELVEARNPVIVGDLPRLARICGEALASDVLTNCDGDDALRQRLSTLFQCTIQALTQEQRELMWSGISEDVRDYLTALFYK